ncbi:class I tRNA ligase family protein [Candidatus Minimicrobia naudis]
MSKSLGNGVGPADIIPDYGAEAFRYYFLRHVPTQDDGDFTWEKFEAAYNGELGNDLGNLVQRVAKIVQSYQAGVIGDAPQSGASIWDRIVRRWKVICLARLMDEIWLIVRSLNQYIERVQPWQVAKNRDKDPEGESHLSEILAHACGTLLQVSGMLRPFMPQTAEKIHDMFALVVSCRQN